MCVVPKYSASTVSHWARRKRKSIRCNACGSNDRIAVGPSNQKEVLQHTTSGRNASPLGGNGCDNLTNELAREAASRIRRGEDETIGHAMGKFSVSNEGDTVIRINVRRGSLSKCYTVDNVNKISLWHRRTNTKTDHVRREVEERLPNVQAWRRGGA